MNAENYSYKSKNFDQFRLEPMPIDINNTSSKVLGYYVYSTAPINVEENPKFDPNQTKQELRKIADYLADGDAEIVISIHGYANEKDVAKNRYQTINQYANKAFLSKKVVFLGYVWPSEKPSFKEGWINAGNALPLLLKFLTLPLGLFLLSLFSYLILSQLRILPNLFNNLGVFLVSVIPALIIGIILALILLRLLTYFRDSYRATNYGVPDLVELLRWLDYFTDEKNKDLKNQIKLSFIGHSMGCFVATNTIRILSDVFDDIAIKGKPTPKIGKVFCLERLVLVAPDIPIQTIMSGRANFLRASLRRYKEAYVFCNEGDLALRLASTIANYFSFPAKKLKSGYRLGNITAKSKGVKNYGIINMNNTDTVSDPFDQLEMRVLNDKDHALKFPREIKRSEHEIIANRVTYFDCTDYVDCKGIPQYIEDTEKDGIVSFAKSKSCLDFFDYFFLMIAHFIKIPREIDTHGGYFKGMFSQKLIYDLAFVGFQEMLKMETYEQKNFSDCCKEKQIKVLLSPKIFVPEYKNICQQ